jgi:predicted AlkP superfamily phosphohydrolase/phosphomutase
MAATEWAIKSLEWELLFTYTTYPDEAEHLWRGFLEPKLSGFRRDLAEQLRPFLEEVYRGCDDFLGLLMRARSSDTVIALISDHGMEGVNRAVKINVALQRSGLIALDRKGQVDLSKTKALYPAINNSYVLINTTDRKDGIVSPEERGQVLEQIRAALKQVRDLGREVVTETWDADIDGPKMGIGGPAGGDVYLDLAPGYDFDPRFGKGDLIVSREPFGTHGFNPLRPSMRTIMAFNGSGVAKGRKLAEIHTLDFAPTLARLLGMASPRDASGRVLTEALPASPEARR